MLFVYYQQFKMKTQTVTVKQQRIKTPVFVALEKPFRLFYLYYFWHVMPHDWFLLSFIIVDIILYRRLPVLRFSFNSWQSDLRHIVYRECYWFENIFYPQAFLTLDSYFTTFFNQGFPGSLQFNHKGNRSSCCGLKHSPNPTACNPQAWYLVASSI